jgi:Pretoxin HINT domain
MVAIVLSLCVSLSADKPAAPEQLRDYEQAKASSAGTAESEVQLALWCEERGWKDKKAEHLAAALQIDPQSVSARALLGLMSHEGKWATPETVSAAVRSDAQRNKILEEYNERRAKIEEITASDRERWRSLEEQGNKLEARARRLKAERKQSPEHLKLGRWCETHGLLPESHAHFTSAVMLDPHNAAAWEKLGYAKHNDRWMTKDQIAAERSDAEAQKRADKTWGPQLKQWSDWLARPERRPEAKARLAEVHEPRAVPSIRRMYSNGKPADQLLALRLLTQIDSPSSTLGLAELAVRSEAIEIRAAAIDGLKTREKRDYADRLVAMIRSPMKYQFQPVQGPGTSGALLVETPRYRLLRSYDAPEAFQLSTSFFGYVGYDGNGLPVLIRGRELRQMQNENPIQREFDLQQIEVRTAAILAEAKFNAASAQQRLATDIRDIENANAQAQVQNDRIAGTLKDTLNAPDFKDDEDKWQTWWYEQIGYRYEPPPQIQSVQRAIPPTPVPYVMSCFIAGTLVRTLDGQRAIERLLVGDQVLSQDVTTGALSYRPVLAVHHNAPSPTLRIKLDSGETLVPSIFHRFWLAGRGWAQARELKTDDVIRTLSGRARVSAIEPGGTEPVYNLDVAESRTFFVGHGDALVHDNSLPSARQRPFDAAPPAKDAGSPPKGVTAHRPSTAAK